MINFLSIELIQAFLNTIIFSFVFWYYQDLFGVHLDLSSSYEIPAVQYYLTNNTSR